MSRRDNLLLFALLSLLATSGSATGGTSLIIVLIVVLIVKVSLVELVVILLVVVLTDGLAGEATHSQRATATATERREVVHPSALRSSSFSSDLLANQPGGKVRGGEGGYVQVNGSRDDPLLNVLSDLVVELETLVKLLELLLVDVAGLEGLHRRGGGRGEEVEEGVGGDDLLDDSGLVGS
jgi:hypothetical protein